MLPESDIEFYLSEGCGQFSMALSKWFPNAKIALLCNNDGEHWSAEFPYEATHACLVVNGVYIDARGARQLSDICEEFSLDQAALTILPYTPGIFRQECVGDDDEYPLYGNQMDILEAMKNIKDSGFLNHLPDSVLSQAAFHPDSNGPEPA